MQKYNSKTLSTIAFIYGLAYIGILIITFYPMYGSNPTLKQWFTDVDIWCPVKCKSDSCKTYADKTRGHKYNPTNAKTNTIKTCAITFWHITHFALYFILAYLFPSFYIEFFFIGILFEFAEYIVAECQDASDVIFNLGGILAGIAVSKMWKS